MTAKKTTDVSDRQALVRVSECLYRSQHSDRYYALLKRGGKQIKRSLKTSDRELAKRRLAEFREKAERLNGNAGAIFFAELAKRWVDVVGATLKASSKFRRETAIKALLPSFRCAIRAISRSQVEAWATKRSKYVSARTYNMERETLILVLDYAVREGLILDNPAKVVPRRKLPKPQIVIPTQPQFKKLVLQIREADRRAAEAANLCEFLAYSGCRLGEATEILWGDVNFERETFSATGGEGGTKNLEARTVPLFPSLKRLLLTMRKALPKEPQPGDKIFTIQNARKAMATACLKAKLPHFTNHSLRHFFCSNAIETGIDFKVIAGWLGHKDGGVLVAKTYGHLRDEHSQLMAKRMTFDVATN